jgi:hypothetical protein
LIITHTYTANLAAFLTVKQLDTKINSVEDLVGKTVATLPTYVDRLYTTHRIWAVDSDGAHSTVSMIIVSFFWSSCRFPCYLAVLAMLSCNFSSYLAVSPMELTTVV